MVTKTIVSEFLAFFFEFRFQELADVSVVASDNKINNTECSYSCSDIGHDLIEIRLIRLIRFTLARVQFNSVVSPR